MESFNKYIPLFSLTIVVCSILKSSIYYSFFGVSINEYMEITEYTIQFIDDLLVYSIFCLLILIFYPITYLRNLAKSKYPKEIYNNFKLSNSLSLIIIVFSIISIAYNLIPPIKISNLEIIKINVILLVSFSITLITFKLNLNKNVYIFSIIIFLVLYSIIDSLIDRKRLLEKGNNVTYSFTYKNKNIISDKNNLIIGRLKNYTFLYNKISKQTFIYENSKIEDFKIQK